MVSALSCLSGHDRYYNKYINVKKGGIGGVAMLLAGYVALSYFWEYDHLSKKQTLPHVLFRMFYIIQKVVVLLDNVTSTFTSKHFLHLFFQNTIAGGSTTEAPQQPSDHRGLNLNLCSSCSFYSQLSVLNM